MQENSGEHGPIVDQLPGGTGRSRIDPDDPAAPYFELLSRLRSPLTLRELMIQTVRSGYIGQGTPIDPKMLPPSAEELYPEIGVKPLLVPSPLGRIRCQVFGPPGEAPRRRMMLYLHGGGFTVGSSEDTAYITSRIAAENDIIVVSVNYRLAPEWPFPAGLDDALCVLNWMRENGASLGGDSDQIFVAGDSAGANMAAALPHKARDEGARLPDGVVLLCPITDFHVEQYPSFERLAPLGIIYDTAFVGYIRGAYVVHHRLWSHPHVSPALGDLRDYPPTVIIAGEVDPIVDDNRAFASKLAAAGRPVQLLVQPKMPHGFYFFPRLLPAGEAAFEAIRRFFGSAR
ncbi:alpha/beta hydrolase [Rhodoligotrophos ferricapiens]|uniref:alpha/beta hydrolase n=1 Tax=Rhodoligotrophos ferricapiens TaxID=3069264 RepID=UPI00315C538C